MFTEIFIDPLRGRTRLWRVVWLYGFVISVCYWAIAVLFLPGSNFTTRLLVFGGVILALLQLVALWQCAYNGRSRSVARLVRTVVVVAFVLVPLLVYLVMTDAIVFSIG